MKEQFTKEVGNWNTSNVGKEPQPIQLTFLTDLIERLNNIDYNLGEKNSRLENLSKIVGIREYRESAGCEETQKSPDNKKEDINNIIYNINNKISFLEDRLIELEGFI